MRVIDGEGVLVRVFIGESDHWHHRPASAPAGGLTIRIASS
jgi:hypothetical protein